MVKGGELELRYVTAVVRRKSGVKAAVYNGLAPIHRRYECRGVLKG